MRLEVTVAGDRRLAEEVILEIQGRAQGYGLDPPAVTLRSHQKILPKAQKRATKGRRYKRRSR
jgi:hypothetical protein